MWRILLTGSACCKCGQSRGFWGMPGIRRISNLQRLRVLRSVQFRSRPESIFGNHERSCDLLSLLSVAILAVRTEFRNMTYRAINDFEGILRIIIRMQQPGRVIILRVPKGAWIDRRKVGALRSLSAC
ncbi:uncharacterized protein [Physcomitrium patens]|uniref:uncharacterized protein isoform X2 n=1 Tax=Physcomitrium patens TaxID=3218 RepID=UPI003CCD2B85